MPTRLNQYTPPKWHNSEKHNASYLRLYKCASSSVVQMLGDPEVENLPKYRKFTVIRNPFDRAISIWNEMTRMRKTKDDLTTFLKDIRDNGYYDKHQLPFTTWLQSDLVIFTTDQLNKVKDFLKCEKVYHINPSTNKPILSEEDKSIIKELYADDIKFYYNHSRKI